MANLKGNAASTHKNFEIVQLPQWAWGWITIACYPRTLTVRCPSKHSTTDILLRTFQPLPYWWTQSQDTCQTWLLPQVLHLSRVSSSCSPLTTPHPHTATVLIERGHEFGSNLQNTGADAVNSVSLLPPPKNTVLRPGDSPQSLSLTNRNLRGCEWSSTAGNMLNRHKSWLPALALFLFSSLNNNNKYRG